MKGTISLKHLIEDGKGIYQYSVAHADEIYHRLLARVKGVTNDRAAIIEQLRQNVASRLAAMPPMEDLHIMFVGPINNWEVVLPKTLRHLGRVSEFVFSSTEFFPSEATWRSYRDELNERMTAAYLEAHRRSPVHLVVGYLSDFNTKVDAIKAMTGAGSIVVNFCFDDKLYFSRRVKDQQVGVQHIAGAVDLNLTSAPGSIVKYLAKDALAVFWPEGAEPDDAAEPQRAPEFRQSVLFVGSKYGVRGRFVERLIAAGIDVAAFGKGWPAGPVDDAKLKELYRTSRVVLGFSSVGYSERLLCLKGRDFEVPMAGALYLTQYNPELSLVYKLGEEIETFSTFADCVRKIRFLLDNPSVADRIRRAGRRRAMAEHSWQDRFCQVLKDVGLKQEQ